jgi:hypothetical protein
LFVFVFADSIRGLTNEVRRSDCRRRSTSTTSWRTPSEPSTTKASSLPNSVRFFLRLPPTPLFKSSSVFFLVLFF